MRYVNLISLLITLFFLAVPTLRAETAISAGAAVLPTPIQIAMGITSKIMTHTSYWV